MQNKLRCAVIGVGNMGKNHVRTYHEIPEVDLVAIVDVNEKLGNAMAQFYNAKYYGACGEMIEKEKPDIISICVPTSLHHKVAMECIEKGINVLLEKPIATNLKEAEEIIDGAKKKGIKLTVGHIERFNPAIQRMKELIGDGRLGDIISINIKRVGGLPPQIKDANVVTDLAIHDIDISNYLLGECPKEVHGFKSKNLVNERDDHAVILLKYLKSSSFIETNWITPVKIRTMDITGTKAFARLDYINQTIILYEDSHLKKSSQYKDFNEFVSKFSVADEIKIGINKKEPLMCEIEDFIDAVLKDGEPLVSGREAYNALEVALKV